MPDDGQVDELPDPVVPQSTFVTAGRARWVHGGRAAGDPRVVFIDRGTGDRQAEFDGADDGVSDKRRRAQVLGAKDGCVVTPIFAPGTVYMWWWDPITVQCLSLWLRTPDPEGPHRPFRIRSA